LGRIDLGDEQYPRSLLGRHRLLATLRRAGVAALPW
jgi:hypothetical protein